MSDEYNPLKSRDLDKALVDLYMLQKYCEQGLMLNPEFKEPFENVQRFVDSVIKKVREENND